MCGIVGYIGYRQAQPILLDSLAKLEYRGYDSCGIAIRGSGIKVCKDAVRVGVLEASSPRIEGSTGIGHTRWATHGMPSAANAHPHLDCTGKIAVVHNGVITNYQKLKSRLIVEGHVFASETDTEVIPHLIEKYYHGDIGKAVAAAVDQLEGSYGIVVLTEDEHKLVVARNGSPLIIGLGSNENFAASDVTAVLGKADKVIYLEDGDVGVITQDSLTVFAGGKETPRRQHDIVWKSENLQKLGYEHFMLKEIHEQPRVIRDTLAGCPLSSLPPADNVRSISILACGTSFHSGLIGKYVIEELAGIPVVVEAASEFNYHRVVPSSKTIFISQSGETADVLTAMKRLRNLGQEILVICNVPGSTACRIADQVIYTRAGPEVSVAATKTFIAQLVVLYQFALAYSASELKMRGSLAAELVQLPDQVEKVFNVEDKIIDCARYMAGLDNAFFVGRGINRAVALEGALKLKEISYIHVEGCPAGELKHGPLALLHKNMPVVAIVAHDNTYEAMLTNIKEVKARNAPVIALVGENDEDVEGIVDLVIKVPHSSAILSPILNAVALQLLAYYTAKFRGCPIDFPRNLAKSVTVE